jgi:lysophospholipase L1-like esterase
LIASTTRRRRIVFTLAAGALLIGSAVAYIQLHFVLPVGSGPAGSFVPLEPFAQSWSEREILLLGIGDSVTAGFGASPGNSYFERIANNPKDEFPDMQGRSLSHVFPRLRTLNLAQSGTNSLQHLERLKDKLEPQSKEVFGLVVMTSGGNDLIHWYGRSPPREGAMYGATLAQSQAWIANFEKRLDEIFTLLEGKFPGGCRIYIADIYDPSDGLGDPESALMPAWREVLAVHAAYNAAIGRAANRHPFVCVVPIHEAFLGHGIHCRQFWRTHYCASDPHYWYASNIEDPNNRGYDAIRRVFLRQMIHDSTEFR